MEDQCKEICEENNYDTKDIDKYYRDYYSSLIIAEHRDRYIICSEGIYEIIEYETIDSHHEHFRSHSMYGDIFCDVMYYEDNNCDLNTALSLSLDNTDGLVDDYDY